MWSVATLHHYDREAIADFIAFNDNHFFVKILLFNILMNIYRKLLTIKFD